MPIKRMNCRNMPDVCVNRINNDVDYIKKSIWAYGFISDTTIICSLFDCFWGKELYV